MPKLDPDDQLTATTTTAPAALPPGATSSAPSFFGASNATPVAPTATTPAPAFGAPQAGGFGSPSTSGFGATPLGGNNASSFSGGGFGGSPGGFGNPSGGFGSGYNQQRPMMGQQQQVAPDANTTAAFGQLMNAQAGQEPEHWMKAFWRPAMGWLYMLICFMDFVAFPMISMFLPIIERGFGVQIGYTAWQSLTLSNGGLIHLAFGGILGVSAFGRTKEKEAGVAAK